MVTRRNIDVSGYYWQISDDYHYASSLAQLVIEVGSRESGVNDIFAYQVISNGDDLPEEINLIYSKKNAIQSLIHLKIEESIVLLPNMASLYNYLTAFCIENEHFQLEYSFHTFDTANVFLVNISYLKDEFNSIDWVKEGF